MSEKILLEEALVSNSKNKASAVEQPRVEQSEPATSPIDPGAAQVADSLAKAIDEEGKTSADATTRIGVWRIRNQSRCEGHEFQLLLDRLARQLTDAGGDHGLVFTPDATTDVQYHLIGTAYLITAGGFDLWEIFLALGPAEKPWAIWHAPGPVTMLRQMRPDQPQIFLSPHW